MILLCFAYVLCFFFYIITIEHLFCVWFQSNSSGEWGVERVGGKFRRLQRRWEMLSGQETSPSKSARINSTMNSTASGGSTPGSAGSTPGSTSGKSKIPRPVTSPVRPHAQTPPANTVSPVKRLLSLLKYFISIGIQLKIWLKKPYYDA